MLSFASSLASQIGYLIANLNKNNYKSVVFELSQVRSLSVAPSRDFAISSFLHSGMGIFALHPSELLFHVNERLSTMNEQPIRTRRDELTSHR